MQHSLFKYFDNSVWSKSFLDGNVFFQSLSYFVDMEDCQVRGDRNEGKAMHRPAGGLVINNLTQGQSQSLPGFSFNSAVRTEEIFVCCQSRSNKEQLWGEFNAIVCVELRNKLKFFERVRSVMTTNAQFIAKPVTYYQPADHPTPRWALPEQISFSKLVDFQWQDEYRMAFSETGALEFQQVSLTLTHESHADPINKYQHSSRTISVGDLRDICRVHYKK